VRLTAKEGQQLVLLDQVFAVSGTKSYVKQAVDQKGSQPGIRPQFPQAGNQAWDLKTSLKVVKPYVMIARFSMPTMSQIAFLMIE